MSSTKTATPIERIPQSIQVVPRSVIEDQTSISVDERAVVQRPYHRQYRYGRCQDPRPQGQNLARRHGLSRNTGDKDAFANVERIEVLKGPSAILYGGGSGAPAGGAINIISKLPTDKAGGEFGVTLSSHSFARPWFDINQPLSANGTVLFRITGEYTSADSYVDVLEQDRYSINPTLTFTNKTDTTLSIQARSRASSSTLIPDSPQSARWRVASASIPISSLVILASRAALPRSKASLSPSITASTTCGRSR